ncbi:MAG: hypothetical protein ACR2ND_05265 [Solirubrobacteraceae bacterium]
MDSSNVSIGERVAAAGGLVLLIALFLKWYGVEGASVNGVNIHVPVVVSISGWHAISVGRWLFLICALLAIALAVAKSYGQTLNLPMTPSVLLCGLGGLSVLWILFRLLSHPGGGLSLSVKFGIFAGLAGAALLAFGAYQTMQEEGASFDELREPASRFTKPDA